MSLLLYNTIIDSNESYGSSLKNKTPPLLVSLYLACQINWIFSTDPSKCPSPRLNYTEIIITSKKKLNTTENPLINENEFYNI